MVQQWGNACEPFFARILAILVFLVGSFTVQAGSRVTPDMGRCPVVNPVDGRLSACYHTLA